MTNFTFIKVDFPDLYAEAIEAEQFVFISPKASAVLMRSVLENSVACFLMYNCSYKLNKE